MHDEGDAPVAVRQLRAALSREFAGLIDMTDFPSAMPDRLRESAFLARALAAKAACLLTDRHADEAASAVIDGADDMGVDAVAFSIATPELWIIQAKWSDRGTARISAEDTHRLIQGLSLLTDRRYEGFNARFQHLAARVDEVLASPAAAFTWFSPRWGTGGWLRRPSPSSRTPQPSSTASASSWTSGLSHSSTSTPQPARMRLRSGSP